MRKSSFKDIFLCLFIVFLFFAFAEIGLRFVKFGVNKFGGYFRFGCFQWAADKYKVPIERQDPCLFWRCQEGNIFRGKEYPLVKSENTFRVICLGDSTTQGYMMQPMVIAYDQTYPYYLEKILKNHSPSVNFEVINAGCGGYSSFQGVQYLKIELLRLNPDLLIVWFGQNDLRSAIMYRDAQQRMLNNKLQQLESFFNRSRFYQFYRQALFYISSLFTKDKRRVSPEEFYNNLKEMQMLAQSRGARVIFITPVSKLNSRIVSLEDEGLADYLKAFYDLRKEDAAVLDLASFFKQKAEGTKYFFDYCHPNPEGNRLIAESIYTALVDNRILQRGKSEISKN